MNERRALRRRPPREPGPRLFPVLLALVIAGVTVGACSKLLFHFFHRHSPPVHPLVATKPTPDYADLPVQPTRMPPIPTPKGTWFLSATLEPYPASTLPAIRPAPLPPRPYLTPVPRVSLLRPPLPLVPIPLTPPPRAPLPLVPVPRTPAPRTALPRRPLARASTPRASTFWGEAVPEASIPPLPHDSPIAPLIPRAMSTPRAAGESGVRARPVAKPTHAGPVRVVRRYLTALIGGDESTAYRMLGAAPGDPHVALTEESFINTSARVSALSSAPEGAGAVVRAEIETAGGLYFATYHVRRQNGRYLIASHGFIKL